ncbi:uncharacterized protein [Spinacia oleracea]|uniref:Reverse transcriptase domain-containing protein n=1 Tax=Spinacia oleracea TaxID=3562 RepID=A0ABM3RHM7_SPIOL|nr:uncharacterized protein LOC130469703 [Spinacia oleracea]
MDVGFIRPSQYPDWVANVVLVPKPNGTWRMCVDYTDLNKACPKDMFPLPMIDRLVGSTVVHAMMSFMDAYSGFHQIPMWPEDQEKTSFVTVQGLYYYKVMSFGLKNASATFQRMVNTVFTKQFGRNIEAYIDNMIVKRDKCSYFFNTIKKKAQFEWTAEAEAAFLRLKEHLHTLPRLFSPLQGEALCIYLAISEHSLSIVLMTEKEGIQLSVYFVSHVLENAELKYPTVEKFVLALFRESKKLQPYLLPHRLVVYNGQPLKRLFTKLEAAGRMLKWAIELNEFDVSYEPRKAVKGKAFSDLIVEMTRPTFAQ